MARERVSSDSVHPCGRNDNDHPNVANLGSPWALDGVGGRSFTDTVHQDHLHIAVTS